MTTCTIYIVDDHVDFLESTRFWLSGSGFEVQTWHDPHQAIEALTRRDRTHAACLLLDLRMPQMSGLDLHDALLAEGADLPVIYMSGHADVPLAVQAMQKGAVTLLEKPFDEPMLEAALQRAFAAPQPRSAPIDTVATPPVGSLPGMQSDFAVREARLTPREREVLALVIQGIYNKNIADRIGLSIKTVELYRARGMAKMQARSVAQLTRMMITREIP